MGDPTFFKGQLSRIEVCIVGRRYSILVDLWVRGTVIFVLLFKLTLIGSLVEPRPEGGGHGWSGEDQRMITAGGQKRIWRFYGARMAFLWRKVDPGSIFENQRFTHVNFDG